MFVPERSAALVSTVMGVYGCDKSSVHSSTYPDTATGASSSHSSPFLTAASTGGGGFVVSTRLYRPPAASAETLSIC